MAAGGLFDNDADGIQRLVGTLERVVAPRMQDRAADIEFVKKVIKGKDFKSLLHIHNEITYGGTRTEGPVTKNVVGMANMICYYLSGVSNRTATDLFNLLTSSHIFALLTVHDKVANKEYPSATGAVEKGQDEVDGAKDNMRQCCVRIERSNTEPLGATIKLNKDGMVVVSRVLHRSTADKSGMLHSGDVIHKINNWVVEANSDIEVVADRMATITGLIELHISTSRPERPPKRHNTSIVRLKALFDYDPKMDSYLPCRSAGLEFCKGTVLHVVNQDDPNWWQAVVDGQEMNCQAGLIPSRAFREKLEYSRSQKKLSDSQQQKSWTLQFKRYKSRSAPRVKVMYDPFTTEGHSWGEILSYEEVIKIAPQVNRPRPLVLVGPQGGPMDLKLLSENLAAQLGDKFGVPVRYHSKESTLGKNKNSCKLVTLQEMEQAIASQKLVEYEKNGEHYLGTSLEEVKNVVQSGRTCLVTLHPQFLHLIKSSGVKPFIVFFRTPTIEHMRKQWGQQHTIGEHEMRKMIEEDIEWERKYSHFFDKLIIFKNRDQACQEIISLSKKLQEEYQWIPASWARQ